MLMQESEFMGAIRLSGTRKIAMLISILEISKIFACKLEAMETNRFYVSTQANILNLLIKLKKDFGLTYLFISHDLNVVAYISDIVAVMHMGKIMEIGTADDIFNNPAHPYTRLLLTSVPDVYEENIKKLRMFSKAFSGKFTDNCGCNFRLRCEYAKKICKEAVPTLRTLNSKNEHFAACNFAENIVASEYFYKEKAV